MSFHDVVLLPSDPTRKFSDMTEARLAFVGGQLRWGPGDAAILVNATQTESGQVVAGSHKVVRIHSVADIDAGGRPIYAVQDERGLGAVTEESLLFTPVELFGTQGEPTRYAQGVAWFIRKRQEDLASGKRTAVTFATALPEEESAPRQRARKR